MNSSENILFIKRMNIIHDLIEQLGYPAFITSYVYDNKGLYQRIKQLDPKLNSERFNKYLKLIERQLKHVTCSFNGKEFKILSFSGSENKFEPDAVIQCKATKEVFSVPLSEFLADYNVVFANRPKIKLGTKERIDAFAQKNKVLDIDSIVNIINRKGKFEIPKYGYKRAAQRKVIFAAKNYLGLFKITQIDSSRLSVTLSEKEINHAD